MPLPLIYLVPGLLAAGAAIWEGWLDPKNDGEWSSKTTFNSRMSQLHGLINTLDKEWKKSPKWKDSPDRESWGVYRDSFGQWYKAVGSKVYLSPSESEISEAKRYSSMFTQWVKTFEQATKTKSHTGGQVPGNDDSSTIPAWVWVAGGAAIVAAYFGGKNNGQ
jgi:hypothetical protein